MSQTDPSQSANGPLPRRVLSPHLQIWRWHITMLASILHRVSAVGTVGAAIMVIGFFVSLALGAGGDQSLYTLFISLAASPLGMVLWVLLTYSFALHLMGGLRHLIWDLGIGFSPKVANSMSMWTIIMSVLLTVAFWAMMYLNHKVIL